MPFVSSRLARAATCAALALCCAGSLRAAPAAAHDGRHDFDFNLGVWHTRIQRVLHPFDTDAAARRQVQELDGTVSVRPLWDGRAQLEEIEADGPKGHWQGMTLFLYNPQARQWSQTFAGSREGLATESLIGAFGDGRGQLYGTDTYEGRAVLVRATWSDITPDAHRFEQAYSDDGGRSWAPSFIAELTRIAPVARIASAAHDGSHDFDFDLGNWKTKSARLARPLSGSSEWTELEGRTVVRPVWGGKANVAEFEADGPKGHLELLALRMYDPGARQWNANFATSAVGILNAAGDAQGVPMIGRREDGKLVFYDQERYQDRSIWVRFMIYPTSPDSARSEQAYSDDNGRSWETNWINTYTREPG